MYESMIFFLFVSSEEIVLSDSEHLEEEDGGYTVAELSRTKSMSRQISRARAGSTLKRVDAAWSVDNGRVRGHAL